MDVSFYNIRSAYDGLALSVVAVLPEGRPDAVLQIAHGMCGSKERFLPFMEYMAERGVACFANDHRGHGESVRQEDDRGYMYGGGQEAVISDMLTLTKHIKGELPGLPLFLIGHSMGSMAARKYLKSHPDEVDGIVVCGSPGFNGMSPFGYVFASAACFLGMGRFRLKHLQKLNSDIYNRSFAEEGPQAWICSDPAVRKAFIEDPKHNFAFTFDASRSLLGLMLQVYSTRGWKVNDPDKPVLFLSGEDDPCMGGIAGLDKAVAVMHDAGYRHISIKIYPAMRHEILNEIGKERVWRDILFFIRRLPTCRP